MSPSITTANYFGIYLKSCKTFPHSQNGAVRFLLHSCCSFLFIVRYSSHIKTHFPPVIFLSAFNHPVKNNIIVTSFPALARKTGPSGLLFKLSVFLRWRMGSHCHKVIKMISTREPDAQNRIIQLIPSVWFKLDSTNKFSNEWKSEGMRNRVYGNCLTSNISCWSAERTLDWAHQMRLWEEHEWERRVKKWGSRPSSPVFVSLLHNSLLNSFHPKLSTSYPTFQHLCKSWLLFLLHLTFSHDVSSCHYR